VTQNTSAYNLGVIATRKIQLGEILVSVPWQFAISVIYGELYRPSFVPVLK
jgi:hypothetical protein